MKRGPEAKIQDDIIKFLRYREWFVRSTHGNMYQSGFPDLFCSHFKFGHRWIEVKIPVGFKFTAAQLQVFPELCSHGSGVWILTAGTHEEYLKLFKPSNWHHFLM